MRSTNLTTNIPQRLPRLWVASSCNASQLPHLLVVVVIIIVIIRRHYLDRLTFVRAIIDSELYFTDHLVYYLQDDI